MKEENGVADIEISLQEETEENTMERDVNPAIYPDVNDTDREPEQGEI